jgi:riboflavin kinase/FMN adenylyltransferase
LGKEAGFTVDVVSPKVIDGESVSSTNIRQALARGDIQKVGRFLGRPFILSGQVIHGAERGRSLGFPTANLSVNSARALPADGVYVTRAYLSNHAYPSVTNIGRRPTFGHGERTVEVYLLDFEGKLYGKEFKIELLERLRAERHFSNPEELKTQISKDVKQAKEILKKGEE